MSQINLKLDVTAENLKLIKKLSSKSNKKPKKKIEFSKLIVWFMSIIALIITAYTMYIVNITGDTTPLLTLISVWFTAYGVAMSFYYNKAKTENKIKLEKLYGKETVQRALSDTENEYSSNTFYAEGE